MENELVPSPQQATFDLSVARPPDQVLAEAQSAARALQEVISKKSSPVIFNGERYLEFEDWQTIGKFYGVTAKVVHTGYLDLGSAQGFEATAVAFHPQTGMNLSSAESICMNDEKNWSFKPLYQLKSMAQTRACAKALRNVFSWVVVLAGYKPTPAEEMEEVTLSLPPSRTEKVSPATPPMPDVPAVISLSPAVRVAEIKNWLSKICDKNTLEMARLLKSLTAYQHEKKGLQWVSLHDLESIARNRPKWIDVIHSKVEEEYGVWQDSQKTPESDQVPT